MYRYIIFLFIGFCSIAINAQDKGQEYLSRKEYEKAKSYFTDLLKTDNTSIQNNIGLGKSLLGLKDYDLAEEHYQGLISSTSSNKSVYYNALGDMYIEQLQEASMFQKMNLAGKAKENYISAVESDPKNIDSRTSLVYFYTEAPGIAGGSITKAKEHAQIVIDQNPEKGYALMSNVYLEDEEYDLAANELLKLSEVGVELEEVYYRIGRLYQDQKSFDVAFEWFLKSIKSNASYGSSYYQYARTAVFSGNNVDISIGYMQKYLTMEIQSHMPDKSSAYWRLGMLYEHKKNIPEAKTAYRNALELNPENKFAIEALNAID